MRGASGRWARSLLLLAAVVGLVGAGPAAAGPGQQPSGGLMPADPATGQPWAWEPGMSMDAAGAVWVAANHCFLFDNHIFSSQQACHDPSVEGALPDFAPVWRSGDGGRSYKFIADPLRTAHAGSLTAPGGEDTDIAVQPMARAGRPAVVTEVSAWGGSATLAASPDGGTSWSVAPVSALPATALGIDRPWLAAAGTCDLYVQYHPISGADNINASPWVDRLDACALADSGAAGQADVVPVAASPVEPPDQQAHGTQVMAKIFIAGGAPRVAYVLCDTPVPQDLNCVGSADHQSVHLATSRDGAASWTTEVLPDAGLRAPLNDGVWPMSASGDGTRLAIAVTDTHHVHLWRSIDSGGSWVHSEPDLSLGAGFATVPSLASRGTQLSVAWYGSGAAVGGRQEWRLVVARSTDDGGTFALESLPPVLATTPAATPLADLLYDDFGALLTSDGATRLAYTESCAVPAGDAACPAVPVGAVSGTWDVVRYARLERPVGTAASAPPSAVPVIELPATSR